MVITLTSWFGAYMPGFHRIRDLTQRAEVFHAAAATLGCADRPAISPRTCLRAALTGGLAFSQGQFCHVVGGIGLAAHRLGDLRTDRVVCCA
jgi:hypothetical protein